jgi:hypothetical protein
MLSPEHCSFEGNESKYLKMSPTPSHESQCTALAPTDRPIVVESSKKRQDEHWVDSNHRSPGYEPGAVAARPQCVFHGGVVALEGIIYLSRATSRHLDGSRMTSLGNNIGR